MAKIHTRQSQAHTTLLHAGLGLSDNVGTPFRSFALSVQGFVLSSLFAF